MRGFVRGVHFQGLLRRCAPRAAASGGANRQRRTLLAECVHFQGLLRPLGARAAASGGANRHPRIAIRSLPAPSFGCGSRPAKYKEKEECKSIPLFSWCTFRDYFAPSGLVPLLRNGANRGFSSGKSTKKKRDAKMHPFFLGALSGTTSSLRSSCRLRRGEPTSVISDSFSPTSSFGCGSRPTKVQRKKRCKNASHFSWCTFRDSNPGPID